MNEQEYRKQLAKITMMYCSDVVDIVHARIETFSKDNYVCKRCNK